MVATVKIDENVIRVTLPWVVVRAELVAGEDAKAVAANLLRWALGAKASTVRLEWL